MEPGTSPITQLLVGASAGDRDAAERLAPLIYDELRKLAAAFMQRERSDHTLAPTELVHEAYVRLVAQTDADWRNRAQFFAVAAEVIRRILVDHARAHKTAKRGGNHQRVELSGLEAASGRDQAAGDPGSSLDLLELEDALAELNRLNPRAHRIVELRFFGGLSIDETAHVLGVSRDTIKLDWRTARAWLRARLNR
jgi:RNA polymerase sigma-70 factor, ECF subfamily